METVVEGKCIITGKKTSNVEVMPDENNNMKLVFILPKEYKKILMAVSI